MKKRVLFLCTHNSCRSQLAEALINHDLPDSWRASSAGTEPAAPHPLALSALAEIGVDHSAARSKHLDEFRDEPIDLAITLCASAAATCPVFAGARRTVHLGFDDPGAAVGTDEQVMAEFRRVRDEIRSRIGDYLRNYREESGTKLKLDR